MSEVVVSWNGIICEAACVIANIFLIFIKIGWVKDQLWRDQQRRKSKGQDWPKIKLRN